MIIFGKGLTLSYYSLCQVLCTYISHSILLTVPMANSYTFKKKKKLGRLADLSKAK